MREYWDFMPDRRRQSFVGCLGAEVITGRSIPASSVLYWIAFVVAAMGRAWPADRAEALLISACFGLFAFACLPGVISFTEIGAGRISTKKSFLVAGTDVPVWDERAG